MADDKKKPDAPAVKTGHDVIGEIVGFFVIVAMLLTATAQFSLVDFFGKSSSGLDPAPYTSKTISADYSFWATLIGKIDAKNFPAPGNLLLGSDVITKGLIQVRREPGGSIIGLQKRGEMAKIVDGGIYAYGTTWWMVNYENPPSGWVDERDITTKFFWYYVINILPILWDYIKIIGWILSGFFGISLIYFAIKESRVPVYDLDEDVESENIKSRTSNAMLTKKINPPTNIPTDEDAQTPEENIKWKHIELLLKSHNTNDWRQAIIEADIMLEDMLDKMGYPGVGIGDKLKNIESGDFKTLDKAWEAHKVRNRIAHDGGEYKFTHSEAVRITGLYYDVFKEFYWV